MTRRWMLSLLVIALCGSLTGCAKPIYVKTGATPQDVEADHFDCEQKVVTMYGGYARMGPGHAIMAGGDLDRCMRSKGYGQLVGGR